MTDRIYKLAPDRTMALRGFDGLGAAAALHSAKADAFDVSGVFRDASDFAVLTLYDADNFYDHPRLKHLPDFNFDGLTLEFDVSYSGLMPLDSPKYPSIDWPFLDAIRADGSKVRLQIYDPDPAKSRAVRVGGEHLCASASFVVECSGVKQYDRLTLWYQNLAFDFVVPEVECTFAFAPQGPGTIHIVRVVGVAHSYVERTGDNAAAIASGLAAALLASPYVATTVDAAGQLNVRAGRDDGIGFDVASGTTTKIIYGIGPLAVAQDLARQINGTDWVAAGAQIRLRAAAEGATVRIAADRPGVDGNMLSMYATWKNDRLRTWAATAKFAGGSSDATWRVKIPFSASGLASVRQMWLTFAPALADGAAYEATEWSAAFRNWSVTGPEDVRSLRIAGAGSVRVEENDPWCSYTGAWEPAIGFYSGGMAKAAAAAGASVRVKYACGSAHDLYLGTSLGKARGTASISIDGGPPAAFDARLDAEADVNTRRRIAAGLPAGEHEAVIRANGDGPFVFDFLEAAVPAWTREAAPSNASVCPALDYSTDHTYKLPPARILWALDELGFAGPMNEYIGVFWWNQRKREGGAMPEARVEFSGTFAAGDAVFLKIGEMEFGKTVFPADTNETIARHFAMWLNGHSVAVWARAEGSVLIVTSRAAAEAYRMSLSVRKTAVAGSTGAWTVTGSLETGDSGVWVVDASREEPLNRAARDWHADLFRECAARGREITAASSMELVNPPPEFAARFRDGSPVITDVGFASLKSTHCAFTAAVRGFQGRVFRSLAALMQAASLRPHLQLGEYVWWFFAKAGAGMAFYHPEISAGAEAALGRPLAEFASPNDDPTVNGGADAEWLQRVLRDHVAAVVGAVRAQYADAVFEVLFPYDVNHPEPAGVHRLGGRLNRFVNFPTEWSSHAAAGFDRLKTEALDFGAWSRNLDLARTAFEFSLGLDWPRERLRHLVPVFRPGYPWEKEVEMALRAGVRAVNFWAFDHVCIYGWPVTPQSAGRSSFQG